MMVETPTIDQQFLDEQIVNFADYRAMIWHPMLLENGSLCIAALFAKYQNAEI